VKASYPTGSDLRKVSRLLQKKDPQILEGRAGSQQKLHRSKQSAELLARNRHRREGREGTSHAIHPSETLNEVVVDQRRGP